MLTDIKKIGKRSKIACLRCSSRKVKCSGIRPSCDACVTSKCGHDCIYPVRSRKILICSTEIEKMEERIRALESECTRLKGIAESTEMKYSSSDPHCLKNNDDSKDNLNPSSTPNEYRSAKLPSEIVVDLRVLEASQREPKSPEVKTNVSNNSSCRMFLGALCSQLTDKLLPDSNLNRDFHIHNTKHRDKAIDQSLFLDDKVLIDPQAVQMVVLPNKRYALKMVNKVFHFFAREYGLFTIAEFEARIEETYRDFQSQDRQWLAYLFITLAIGEQYTNEVGSHPNIPGMDFFLKTLQLFHEPAEQPTVDSVRTLLLIAFYSQGLNRINAVFTYTGLALSTAMILGMHRRISYSDLSKRENESRRKLWWTACLMDSLWASRLSLPPHFNTEDMDVEFPSQEMSSEDGFVPSYLIANAQLALCVRSVMKEVYGIGRANNFIRNTINSVESLESFFDNLDPALKIVAKKVEINRSTENLHLRYNQMIVVIVRPLYFSSFKDQKISPEVTENLFLKCIDAALLNVNILNNLFNSRWYSAFGFLEAQCCFSSILILVIEALKGRSFPELPMALSLNAYMCRAGNITAMSNHQRLIELDRILFEAEKQKSRNENRATVNDLPVNSNGKIIKKRKVSFGRQQHSLSTLPNGDCTLNDLAAVPTSFVGESDLPFLVDLESSGILFGQFSPETLDNLSLNFEKWDT
ncbi:hypothetical protein HG535_0C06540 [Zygotorulaspora mrakii]|uniref:Zn(2)-C6 fungal-type domain-containing protein n=1 Tax=Zygotorulaspora mrakii TaxID=42260 RepID=A0A7H9B2U9_ZYGMR|nr:uncharacterized protein HG535_0C06540 [Zygotorulaspora mrakii]QLG72299.1 hypothetical protein HG535_0C06540 [Zygotorulaspora mrakii]